MLRAIIIIALFEGTIIIYKAIWTPITGEQLFLKAEDRNEHDEHATNSEENVIGHMPHSLLPVS